MTKTCPHCHATVLSTSQPNRSENERHAVAHARYQVEHATPENPDCCFDYELVATLLSLIPSSQEQPNLMGTTPELQKMYDEFGGEAGEAISMRKVLEESERLMAYFAGETDGMFAGSGTPVSCLANIRAALAATPAVGGEREALEYITQRANQYGTDGSSALDIVYELDRIARSALAAPPASPLRGREDQIIEACAEIAEPWAGFWLDENSTAVDRAVVEIRVELAKRIRALASASPPEQPAALPLAVRLRDEAGPSLPQMIAQRRAQLSQEQPAAEREDKNI